MYAFNKQPFRLATALAGLLLLNGCAATGQRFTGFQSPAGESSEIIVYRPDLFRAGGESVKITVDGQDLGILRNAGWLAFNVSPGERAIRLEERFTLISRNSVLMVAAKKGESVALRVLPGGVAGIYAVASGPVMAFGPWSMQQVPREVAAEELRNLKKSN